MLAVQVSTMACGGHHTAAVGDHLQVMTWGGGAKYERRRWVILVTFWFPFFEFNLQDLFTLFKVVVNSWDVLTAFQDGKIMSLDIGFVEFTFF